MDLHADVISGTMAVLNEGEYEAKRQGNSETIIGYVIEHFGCLL